MKKSIIALAVVGAMTAPIIAQADATLYGRIHERVVFQEDKDMAIQSAGSRLGVKGSSEMDSGLTSFYQMELSFGNSARSSNSSTTDSTSLSVRQMNAGIKGDFGKVIIGRFTNPFVATYTADVFERESGLYELAPFRIGNAVAYTTPTVGGVNATVGLIGEGEGSDDTYEDVDGYVFQVGGNFGAFSINAAYMDTDYATPTAAVAQVGTAAVTGVSAASADFAAAQEAIGSDEAEIASIGVSYNANGLYVGLGFEENDVTSEEVLDFGVKYTVGKTSYGIGFAEYDGTDATDYKSKERAFVGVYHDLGGSADTYLELASHDQVLKSGADDDFNRVTIGYRVKF